MAFFFAAGQAIGSFSLEAAKAVKGLDVQHGKPVVNIVDPRKTVVPIAIASVVFFTWSLAYGLLDVMNVSSYCISSLGGHADRHSITFALPWAHSETKRPSSHSDTT